jgi:hypothetical protein
LEIESARSGSTGRGGESFELAEQIPEAARELRRVHDHRLTREVDGQAENGQEKVAYRL